MQKKGNWPALSRRAVLGLAGALTAGGIAQGKSSAQEGQNFSLATFAEGFDRPMYMLDANDGSGRFFVAEQGGAIRIVVDGEIVDELWLDLSGQVSGATEQGLLGLALHPQFAENGVLFVDYTDLDGNTQVVRYTQSADNPNRVDPDSASVILMVEQPARNHNGGMLLFGPDGYLYVGLGDGGGQGDPEGHGQNTGTLLGSILRIDIDSASDSEEYAVPDDNPFTGVDAARPEIWAYGFRNPWRFSFDRETGDMWIGDVGQNSFEEVNLIPSGASGLNFGWSLAEGFSCYNNPDCESADIVWPVFVYGRDLGISVVGGYVYRGSAVPELSGKYLLADYGAGFVWELTPQSDGSYAASEAIPTDLTVSSFAEDTDGELYLINLNGSIHKIVAL